MYSYKFPRLAFIVVSIVFCLELRAQEEFEPLDDHDFKQVETELEGSIRRPVLRGESPNQGSDAKIESSQISSSLEHLAPAREISVIERRFLPTTNRFQFFAGLNYVANDPWYWGGGFTGKLAYQFADRYGAELTGAIFSSAARDSINDLANNIGVNASTFVTMKSLLQADFVYTPIYGKFAIFNKRIVSFDMYTSVGVGTMNLASGESSPSFHLGVGQIYGISKAMAFRWDLSWQRFSGRVLDASGSVVGTNTYDYLFVLAGLSFFFPEAKYR